MRVGKNFVALAATTGLLTWALPGTVSAQQEDVIAHSVSVNESGATVLFELANGREVSLSVRNGTLRINGAETAGYRLGSSAVDSWRQTLLQGGRLSTGELLAAISEWEGTESADVKAVIEGVIGTLRVSALQAEAAAELARTEAALAGAAARDTERTARQQLEEPLIDLSRLSQSQRGLALQLDDLRDQLEQVNKLGLRVEDAQIHVGDITVPRGRTIETDLVVLAGDVSIFGEVEGNVIALDGDVILHRNGVVGKDVVTVNGRLTRAGGTIRGRAQSGDVQLRLREAPEPPRARMVSPVSRGTSLLSIIGMFVALSCIGFGFTFFAPRQLDIVADTVTESFGKSFFAGLFATPLVPAAFVTLIIGLILTVVGILLIPFAILASILAVIAAATGGYLAVAQSVGSTYLTRRMAQGHAVTATPYKSLVYGLMGLMAIWLPAALLGWIPVVGAILAMLAAVFTWVMVTAGFGAAILSRAGLRATFSASPRLSALTDEHYWPMDTGSHAIPSRTGRSSERS